MLNIINFLRPALFLLFFHYDEHRKFGSSFSLFLFPFWSGFDISRELLMTIEEAMIIQGVFQNISAPFFPSPSCLPISRLVVVFASSSACSPGTCSLFSSFFHQRARRITRTYGLGVAFPLLSLFPFPSFFFSSGGGTAAWVHPGLAFPSFSKYFLAGGRQTPCFSFSFFFLPGTDGTGEMKGGDEHDTFPFPFPS